MYSTCVLSYVWCRSAGLCKACKCPAAQTVSRQQKGCFIFTSTPKKALLVFSSRCHSVPEYKNIFAFNSDIQTAVLFCIIHSSGWCVLTCLFTVVRCSTTESVSAIPYLLASQYVAAANEVCDLRKISVGNTRQQN